jgi:hypothetical protein
MSEPWFTATGEPFPLFDQGPSSVDFGFNSPEGMIVNQTGTYEVSYTALGQAQLAGTTLGLQLEVNGNVVIGSTFSSSDGSLTQTTVSGQVLVSVNAGDMVALVTTTDAILQPTDGSTDASIIFTQLDTNGPN